MSQKNKKKSSQKSSKNEKISSQNSSSQEENVSSDFPLSSDSYAGDYEILKPTDVIKLMDQEIQKIHEVVDVSKIAQLNAMPGEILNPRY